jgi:UDP-N-acetylmuramate dehydrogenase
VIIRSDVPLATYTTLGVGGPARWLIEAGSPDELLAAVRFARWRNAPFFLLGGGSNLLVSDQGFPGVAIRYSGNGRIEIRHRKTKACLEADAGVEWDAIVLLAVTRDLAGIECLVGIPGLVGGTPVQNVGAYGQEVSSAIQRVYAIDLQSEKPVEFTAAQCGFAYRRSIFNTSHRGRYAITRVDYALKPGGAPHIEYRDLKQSFAGKATPSLLETASAVRTIRAAKGMLLSPGDADSRSAGSFFKNPIVRRTALPKLAAAKGCPVDKVPQFPVHTDSAVKPRSAKSAKSTKTGADFAGESAPEGKIATGKPDQLVKLSAAWLIELAGFHRGYTMERAALSTKHVLAIVNRGGATAAEIVALRDAVVDAVHTKTGIRLEQEPVSIGF